MRAGYWVFLVTIPGVLLALRPAWAGALERAINGMSAVIDLTHPFNGQIPTWPGDEPFTLEQVTDYTQGFLTNRFSASEHTGTHVDAPAHFFKGKATIEEIQPRQLIGSAVVLDIAKKAEVSPDYLLTVQDLTGWERRYGRIPKGAFILIHTGWGKRWRDPLRYLNLDERGIMHFPAFSKEVVEFLLKYRDVKGIGTDTLSVDPGSSTDFPVHHLFLSSDRLIIEGLANLEKVPPKGTKLIVTPLSIEGGSGAPARVLAILP